MLRFYGQCFKLAGKGIFGVIGDFGTLFAIILAYEVWRKAEWVNDPKLLATINAWGGWIIPILLFGGISIARLILAPYWLYRKRRDEVNALNSRLSREAPYFLSLTQRVNTHELINKFEISLGYINKGSRNALKVSASLWMRDIELTAPATVVNHKSANEVPPEIELHLGSTFARTALVIKPQFVVLVVSYLKDHDQAVPSVDSFFYKWDGIKDDVMPMHLSHASMEQRKLIEPDVLQDLERRGLLA